MPFTENEEKFINASVAVVLAGETLRQVEANVNEEVQAVWARYEGAVDGAMDAMKEAVEASRPYGDALGFEGSHEDLRRLNQLMREAAYRAGFDDESPVVEELNAAAQEVDGELRLIEALQEEADEAAADATQRSNPVI